MNKVALIKLVLREDGSLYTAIHKTLNEDLSEEQNSEILSLMERISGIVAEAANNKEV